MNEHVAITPSGVPEPSPVYNDEAERLRVLHSFEVDALQDDPELNAIASFAARLCNVPIAQVTLVEEVRQRFLAGEGLEVDDTPREVSFCQHAMQTCELMEVHDATEDERFVDNDLVTRDPGIRYYAGQPLISDEGAPLGALCVIDTRPNQEGLSDFQREGLAVLGQAVLRRLRNRRENLQAERAIAEREERMRRMIDGVPQIAWSADARGNFEYFNRRWKELTGETPPATLTHWKRFIHPEDWETAKAEWLRCFAAGEEYEAEFRLCTREHGWLWMLAQAAPVAERRGDPLRWFGTLTDIDEGRQLSEERDVLAKELSHRIKNIFAVVIGLATMKARKAPEHESFARDLTDTLRSLSRAHDFVRPQDAAMQESLQGLLSALFEPYRDELGGPRVHLSGEDAEIHHRAATPLALVFHELATNSAKYGALSADDGHVDLVAEDRGDVIGLVWTEHGGPPAVDAGERGFGSRLVEMSVRGQLQGEWDRRFTDEGLIVELTVSKDALAG
ncbi:sensor histidine kinase [Aurantiacibacter spongiae]|uniref:histidine kinase n=1 Tax=Aurantiacibacter spongiae TaxID=2488860 RepID=A0A3N5CY69_9SPHN|nr:PAS domain-containing protein [Aurantiacibacter spongiae]RPF71599.1 PAS domain S-box protein [Aurantiacibacter spongiae]